MTDDERTLVDAALAERSEASHSIARAPGETLRIQEVARMRIFVAMALALSVVIGVALPLIDRPPAAELWAWLGIALGAPAALWFGWQLRTQSGYSPDRALAFGFTSLTAALTGLYLFGVFSPASAGLALGLYLVAPGQEARPAWFLYAATALLHVALTLAVSLRVLPDYQMVTSTELPPLSQVAILILAQILLFLSFVIGRTTRKTLLTAIEQHDRAQRAIAQRAQLLREAHEELARALSAGGMGRFTDEKVDRYELGSVLGRGGMGEVYDAVDTATRRHCAVKILYPHAAADRGQVERFLREARLATQIDAENVCRVLDVGSLPSGIPYLVMERLVGEDLADILRRDNRVALAEVVTLVTEVARGLDAARVAGVVHRDIKPRNLYAAERADGGRTWKILDFGVSKAAESSGTLTQGQIVGTPRYMAPEQAAGRAVDHRADQFSLATVAYRAITGRPAFTGESMPEILYEVLRSTPPRPSSIVRVPSAVDVVLAKAMAKDPAERFDTAGAFARALARAAR